MLTFPKFCWFKIRVEMHRAVISESYSARSDTIIQKKINQTQLYFNLFSEVLIHIRLCIRNFGNIRKHDFL